MHESLQWDDLPLGDHFVPAGTLLAGEYMRLVMPVPLQQRFMERLFCAGETSACDWQIAFQSDEGRYPIGTSAFTWRIGSLIRDHGILANLTLGENLLLPFLYQQDREKLLQAEAARDKVATWLGVREQLAERAGVRSTYMHALISLGRCMLTKPRVIVAQEAHIGMSPEHLAHFRALSGELLQELDCGLLYLSDSADEGSALTFAKSVHISSGAGAKA